MTPTEGLHPAVGEWLSANPQSDVTLLGGMAALSSANVTWIEDVGVTESQNEKSGQAGPDPGFGLGEECGLPEARSTTARP